MPADKRKMWLGDGVQFYEPIEELGGTFETRLGNFRIFHRIQANIRTKFSIRFCLNSRRKIDHSMVDLVLKALESTDAHIGDY